jgi:hypothetical protein
MGNPTIVVLTARNDLDEQLFSTFARCSDLLRQPPVQAADRKDLREKLKVGNGGVVFTTIHAVPHDEALRIRDDVAFFQTVRAGLIKSTATTRKSDEDLDHAIRQIISRAMVSDEVVDLFAAAGLKKPDISILSDEFLAAVGFSHSRPAAVRGHYHARRSASPRAFRRIPRRTRGQHQHGPTHPHPPGLRGFRRRPYALLPAHWRGHDPRRQGGRAHAYLRRECDAVGGVLAAGGRPRRPQ